MAARVSVGDEVIPTSTPNHVPKATPSSKPPLRMDSNLQKVMCDVLYVFVLSHGCILDLM